MSVAREHQKLLEEIRSRFQYATDEWREIRQEADTDMRYVAGDPWDPDDRKARKAAGRPCLSMDELGQHFNQVINGVRSNKRAIKFAPTGNGANEKTADFYRDKTREIEYRSHAQTAYTTAFQDAVHRSYGFLRLTTKFKHERSFNQEIWIESVPDPNMVLPDPDAKRPDSSDMKYCFVYEQRTHDEFTREFPDAKVVNFAPFLREPDYNLWLDAKKILIAEYWTIKLRKRRLLLVQPPAVPTEMGERGLAPKPIEIFEDELDLGTLPPGATIIKDRPVDYPSVCQYLTNGLEILKKTEWPGKYIPIASCYGMVIWVQGKRQIVSMTRLARDPYMLYCYYRTCEAELVGMTPKFPYFAYKGQLDATNLENIAKSLHEPVAVILIDPQAPGAPAGQVLPPPSRQPYEPPIQALEMGAESARRGIQAAMGISPLPTQAQRRNEKSGVALEHMEDSAQRGSFHFNDHYDDLIRHAGVMIEDLIGKIHTEQGETGIRKPNDTAMVVPINDPANPDALSTKGEHQVTVSTGPSFDSEREAESAFADALLQSPFGPRIADLAVKLKGGGPVLDEIADRLTPPEFRKPKEGEGPDPQQLMQEVGKAKQENETLKQGIAQLSMEIKSKQADLQSREKIAYADTVTSVKLQQMKDATTIAVAKIAATTKGIIAVNEAELEAIALAHEAEQNEHARSHEVGMAAMAAGHAQDAAAQGVDGQAALAEQGQAHSLESGDVSHQQALEQGAQSQAHALEQGQQAADLAPQPEAGA